MTVGEIIPYIMLFFAVIGAIDKAFGSKLGIGVSFERALASMGALVIAMVGPMAVAPLLAKYLAPVMAPVCEAIGIDPSITAGVLLASDAGGWSMATALAQDEAVGKFSGAIVASMMGCTITGAFPMCFMLAPKEKIPLVAKGLTIGFITIPIGCFVGGVCMGLNFGTLMLNLLPLTILSALFVIGITFFERVTVKIVTVFGYIITALVTLCLALAMAVKVIGVNVPDLVSFDDCIIIIGGIAIFLCGAFVLLELVQKFFGKGLRKIGVKIGLDEQSNIGVITTAINAIPMFSMMKNMNERGVVINIAFMICASFVIGDHLAFQTTVDSSMAVPLIAGKLAGGILGIVLAVFMTKQKKVKEI